MKTYLQLIIIPACLLIFSIKKAAPTSASSAFHQDNPVTSTINSSTCPHIISPRNEDSETVTLCDQVWMKKNLDVTHYRNGDPIPKVTDTIAWRSLTTGAYCYYNNDSAKYASTYGKLYNWYAVIDIRGLAPAGWHVASRDEWKKIDTCLGDGIVHYALREPGTEHWIKPNSKADSRTGFSALPGGQRSFDGTFLKIGVLGFWWSSSTYRMDFAWYCLITDNGFYNNDHQVKTTGSSVRCVKD